MYWDQNQIDALEKRLQIIEAVDDAHNEIIQSLLKRVELCEKVFIKIMQHDVRLQTLEFNSPLPVEPSASEKLLDMQLRLERLESYLINGAKNE